MGGVRAYLSSLCSTTFNNLIVSMPAIPDADLLCLALPDRYRFSVSLATYRTLLQQEGSKESRNANDKAALAAKVAAKKAAKEAEEAAAAKAAAQGPAVVAKKKKDKKANDASLDDLLSAGLAGGKKKGKK